MKDLLDFYTNAPLLELGAAADAVRREKHPDGIVTFIVDRNINYTNVCVADCGFCAFYRRPKHAEGWSHDMDEILRRCGEAVDLGATQVMLQGGHHPDYGVDYYENLFSSVKSAYPDLVISVDTWRHDVGRAACEAGASLLNDTWGGWDPKLPEVAAELGAGLVCSHAGGLPPRTRPFRVRYDDVVADVLATVLGLAGRALRAGVDQARIIIDQTG